jgi:hypothetical protein
MTAKALNRSLRRWIIVIVVLTSCGGTGVHTAAPTSKPAATQPVPPIQTPPAAPTATTADAVGLHVVSVNGPMGQQPGGILCPLWIDRLQQIVVASSLLALSDSDAQSLRNQWAQVYSLDRWNLSKPLPVGVRRVPGAIVSESLPRTPPDPGYGGTTRLWGPGCTLALQVTNTSKHSIQIISADLQLANAPDTNDVHYNLINQCPLEPLLQAIGCGVQLGGGPTPCQVYIAPIQLVRHSAPFTFHGAPAAVNENRQPCPDIVIDPGATFELWIEATSSKALVYSVIPQLAVQTVGGPKTVALTDLAGIMAFAELSQFSCYVLQGSSWMKVMDAGSVIKPPLFPSQATISDSPGAWLQAGQHWCV